MLAVAMHMHRAQRSLRPWIESLVSCCCWWDNGRKCMKVRQHAPPRTFDAFRQNTFFPSVSTGNVLLPDEHTKPHESSAVHVPLIKLGEVAMFNRKKEAWSCVTDRSLPQECCLKLFRSCFVRDDHIPSIFIMSQQHAQCCCKLGGQQTDARSISA